MNRQRSHEPLIRRIKESIEQHPKRAIPFRDYMEMCLYDPEYGYYTGDRVKIGKEGDFYTSSSVGSLMGEMLARYVASLYEAEPRDTLAIVEWGGGTGRLAAQLLDELRSNFPHLYAVTQFTAIETSELHRRQQRQTLKEHAGKVRFATADQWFAEGPWQGAIVFSNELLDAFPVHRVRYIGGVLYEIHITWDEAEGAFREVLHKCEEGPLKRYFEREGVTLREGQTAEVNLACEQWIERIGRRMENGWLITIDYGDTAEEIYADHRMNGTLMCYSRHTAHDNPYVNIGEQDITAHINFSACVRAGKEAGFTQWSLMTQKQFLLEAGILGKLQNYFGADPFHPIARKNRAIRQLLLSDRMSELFKVLVQKK